MRILGKGTRLEDVYVAPGVSLVLGDNVQISPGVRIIGTGTVRLGDYSKVHAGCFINVPFKHSIVEFGCNSWIGERSVLDGTGGITASHNVGVGIASQLYSHIAHGDVMAGCRFKSEKPLIIGKDAWFVGQCLVSPVNVGERSVAMLGSTITHDMFPNTIYAGVPAKEMTEKMGRPWTDRPSDERLVIFRSYIEEFRSMSGRKMSIIEGVEDWPLQMKDNVTYFNVNTRTYTKRSTFDEMAFMSWLTSWRARFVPEETL